MLSLNHKFYSPSPIGIISLVVLTRHVLNLYSALEHICIPPLINNKVNQEHKHKKSYCNQIGKTIEANKYPILGYLVGSVLSTTAFFANRHADQCGKSKLLSCFLIAASVLSSTFVYYIPNMMHSNHSNHK